MLRNTSGATQLIKNRTTPKLKRWGTAGPPAVRRQLRGGWRLVRRLNSLLLPFVLFAGAGYGLARQILTSTEKSVLGLVAGLCVLPILASRVEIGIITVMLIVATIIYPAAIPRPFVVGGNGFDMVELLVLALLVVVFVRRVNEESFEFFRSPITVPLLMFVGTVVVATIVSMIDQSPAAGIRVTFSQVLNSGPRAVLAFLFFFPVAFGVRTEKHVRGILRALTWICVLVALVMIAQYFVGRGTVLAIGTPETGKTWVGEGDDAGVGSSVVRSIPPGLAPMLVFFLFSLTYISFTGAKRVVPIAAAAAIMGIGIVFSFTRNFWVPTFVGMFLVACLSPWEVRRRFILLGAILAFGIVGLSLAVGQMNPSGGGYKFAKALDDRFLSIFEKKTIRSSSLQNRVIENRNAIELIKKHPITGLGIGRPLEYRYLDTRRGFVIVPNFLIHNSFFGLYLQNGVFCMVALVWLSIAFLIRCYRLFRRARDPLWKAMGVAFLASYIGTLIKATTGMVFQQPFDMCTMCLMWGLVESVHFLLDRGELEEDKDFVTREQTADARLRAI